MFRFRVARRNDSHALMTSGLLDQNAFYASFLADLKKAKREVIIESPFIAAKRLRVLLPTLRELARRGVRVIVNTKPLEEQELGYRLQAEQGVAVMQHMAVLVLFTDGHHRKLAIVDRKVLYEGSLNILSQNDSCEIMRRIDSEQLAKQMLRFLNLEKFIS